MVVRLKDLDSGQKKSGVVRLSDLETSKQPDISPVQKTINSGAVQGLTKTFNTLRSEKLPELQASPVQPKTTWEKIKSLPSDINTGVESFFDAAANTATFGLHNKLLQSHDENQRIQNEDSIVGKAGGFAGAMVPIGGAYATGGKLAAGALSKLAPSAGKFAQNLVRGAGAGLAYGTANQGLDAALDTHNDGFQTFGDRAKAVGIDTALFAAGDAAMPYVAQGVKAAGKGIKSAYDSLAKDLPTSGISAFASKVGQKLRSPQNPQSIKELIDVGGKPSTDKGGLWERFRTAFVESNAPLQRTETQLGGKNLPIERSPHKQAWLAKGWKGKADTKLEYGFMDSAGNKIGQSLKEAVGGIKTKLDDWRQYAVALRSKEYADVSLESGVSPELADAAIAKFGNDAAVLNADKSIKEYVTNMNQSTLVDSGIWSPEKLTHYADTQPNYIPMFRTQEKGLNAGMQGAGTKSLSGVKDPTKKRAGSNQPIVDPLESIVKQTYKNQSLAERNNVVNTLAKLAESNPDNGIVRVVQGNAAELAKFQKQIDDTVLNPTGDMEAQTADIAELFKPRKVGNNYVATFMRGGKPMQMEISDPQLAKVIGGLNDEGSNFVLNLMGRTTGVLKAGLTLAPDFVAKNLIRDQMSAFVNSKYGFIPIWDTVSGLISAAKHDKFFYQWMGSGGANGAWVSLERDYLQGQIQEITKSGIKSIQMNPLEYLRKLSEWSEQGTRLGEFKRGLKKGASLQEAALASRDVTLDFSRSGTIGKQINKPVAFFNVAVQSLDKMARQFKERPAMTAGKAALSITAPSILLFMMNHNNPAYQELPQWEKDAYWHIFAGKEIIKIPKPFEMGVTFGTFFERTMSAWKDHDPKAFDEYAKTMIDGFTPNIIPTLFVPWIEAFANKKTFGGAPVVPKREEGLLKKDQYGAYTSELSKKVGEVTGWSPRIVDNTIGGYTGTLGKYGLQMADNALKMSGVANPPPKPEPGLASKPVLRSFLSKGLEGSSQSLDDFYKEKDKLTRQSASAKKNEEKFVDKQKLTLYNKLGGKISGEQKKVREILDSRSLTPEQKREQLKQSNLNITNLARKAKGLDPIGE